MAHDGIQHLLPVQYRGNLPADAADGQQLLDALVGHRFGPQPFDGRRKLPGQRDQQALVVFAVGCARVAFAVERPDHPVVGPHGHAQLGTGLRVTRPVAWLAGNIGDAHRAAFLNGDGDNAVAQRDGFGRQSSLIMAGRVLAQYLRLLIQEKNTKVMRVESIPNDAGGGFDQGVFTVGFYAGGSHRVQNAQLFQLPLQRLLVQLALGDIGGGNRTRFDLAAAVQQRVQAGRQVALRAILAGAADLDLLEGFPGLEYILDGLFQQLGRIAVGKQAVRLADDLVVRVAQGDGAGLVPAQDGPLLADGENRVGRIFYQLLRLGDLVPADHLAQRYLAGLADGCDAYREPAPVRPGTDGGQPALAGRLGAFCQAGDGGPIGDHLLAGLAH